MIRTLGGLYTQHLVQEKNYLVILTDGDKLTFANKSGRGRLTPLHGPDPQSSVNASHGVFGLSLF